MRGGIIPRIIDPIVPTPRTTQRRYGPLSRICSSNFLGRFRKSLVRLCCFFFRDSQNPLQEIRESIHRLSFIRLHVSLCHRSSSALYVAGIALGGNGSNPLPIRPL